MPTTEHSEVETRRRRSLLQPTIEEVVQPYHEGRMENDDTCFWPVVFEPPIHPHVNHHAGLRRPLNLCRME